MNNLNTIADFACNEIKDLRNEAGINKLSRDILIDALAEIKAINDKINNTDLSEIIEGCIAELSTMRVKHEL